MQPTKIKTVAPKTLQTRKAEPKLYSLSDILNGVPIPEEEATPADLADIEEARQAYARGESIAHEKLMKELGLC